MARKKQTVICENCQKHFDKEVRYIKAAEKKDRGHFCSISCSTSKTNKTHNKNRNYTLPQNQKGYKQDRYSLFSWYVARANSRKKNNGITIDILNELWQKQEGKCAISNLSLQLHDECTNKLYMASLDRIDSSKPYQEDNIQFVAYPLNLGKQSFTQEEFVSFLREMDV